MTGACLARSLLFAGALLVPASSPAAQRAPDLDAVRSKVHPDVAVALTRAVEEARRRDIPASPLMDKALEGTAKQVPPDRIVAALRTLAAELEQARSLLEGAGPAQLRHVEAVAVALRRRAPPEAVRRLATSAPATEELGVTMNVLADLTERGVEAGRARDLLLAWRAQGADGDALRRIPLVVDRLMREGVLPSTAASAIEGALRRGGPPESVGPPKGVGPPRVRPPGGS